MITLEKLDTLRGKPEELKDMKSVRQLVDDLTKANWLLWLAGVAAFLASAMFVVKYFVGGDLTPSVWTGEQWANAWLGLGITLVVTFGQGLLYASGYKGPAALVAVCIVVFFGLFSEVSQSMEREDATVRHRSENSPVFQTALGSIGKLTDKAAAPSPAQQALASAQGEVHRWEAEQQKKAQCHTCSEYSTRTIGSKLAEAQGRVAAAREQVAAYQTSNASALSTAIAQAKALEYDEDKHYGMIRLLKHMFSVEGIVASFLFSVVVIGTFEYIFHFIGTYVGNHRKALQLLGLNADGSPFEPAPSLPALPSSALASPTLPVAAGTGGTGQTAVSGTDAGTASGAGVRPLPGMIPADHFARDWLRMDYSTTNPTCPMPGFAPPVPPVPPGVSGSLSSLTGKVKHQGHGGQGSQRTGTQHPGTAGAKQVTGKYPTGKVDEGNEVQVAESVYLTLCKLVRGGQLRPSRPGLKKALQKMQVGSNQVERQAMADLILRHMEQDGVVYRNPAYTGPSCGLGEFLPVLEVKQVALALAG
jgi:cytochrome c2